VGSSFPWSLGTIIICLFPNDEAQFVCPIWRGAEDPVTLGRCEERKPNYDFSKLPQLVKLNSGRERRAEKEGAERSK